MKFEDFIQEGKKITLKRQYTEKHPAITVGKSAKVRNKMLEAVADGKITQEEFNNILKEYSSNSSKWMKRNAKFFNVSEEGISLTGFGKKALSAISINEEEPVEESVRLFEATVDMDAMDPNSKGLAKLLKKHKVKMEILDMNGPSGNPEVRLTGKRKDLEAVLADDMYGWDDPDLAEYIEEGNAFGAARAKAIADGEDSFEVDGETYPVEDVDKEDKENAEEFAGESFIIESFSKFVESLFVNEAKYSASDSASDIKKLKKFSKDISDKILNFPDLKDLFQKGGILDKEDYSPESMFDYLLKWGFDKSVNYIIKYYDWEGDWVNLDLPY